MFFVWRKMEVDMKKERLGGGGGKIGEREKKNGKIGCYILYNTNVNKNDDTTPKKKKIKPLLVISSRIVFVGKWIIKQGLCKICCCILMC
eukprot:UN03474